MYALKIDGAINFAPISSCVKNSPEPTILIEFEPPNSTSISLPDIVVPTPGVNTWPWPEQPLQVLIFNSVKAFADTLNLVGRINFLLTIISSTTV